MQCAWLGDYLATSPPLSFPEGLILPEKDFIPLSILQRKMEMYSLHEGEEKERRACAPLKRP